MPWVSPKDMKADIVGETEDWITKQAVENSAAKYYPILGLNGHALGHP